MKIMPTITKQHVELAIAWVKGEIAPVQLAHALGLKLSQGNYQRHIAFIMQEGYKHGWLKLTMREAA